MFKRVKSSKSVQFTLSDGDQAPVVVGFSGEKTVLEVALENRIPLHHSCEGMASCGTCRVIVESDLEKMPDRNELESEMAHDRGFAPNERLACQVDAFDSLRVRIPSSED